MILIDIVPFFRFAAAIICFGLSFFFLGLMVTAFTDLISFEGSYATVLLSLWAILPAVVLLFSGIRLIMVKQKVM